MTIPVYEVYAIRYASVVRRASTNFIIRDEHDGPMPLDFFTWLIKCPDRCFAVDTGFNEESARRRNRKQDCKPTDALAAFGLKAEDIDDVIITHLHFDHGGNLGLFPNAKFHIQDAELAYATGRHMCHRLLREVFELDDVLNMVRHVYAERVRFHQGDAELAPGVSVHAIGGHTAGLQAVRVHTARGWVVLASDAAHYYANMARGNPFPIVYNVAEMMAGYDRVLELADSPEHVIPGHDPEVLRIYPRFGDGAWDIAALHRPPTDKPVFVLPAAGH